MRNILLLSIITFTLISCSSKKDYNPQNQFKKTELDSILFSVIVLSDEHRPDSITVENRTQAQNREFFKTITDKYTFDYLYKSDSGVYYYFIHKLGRGVTDLYVGIGGKFKLDKNLQLSDFEESYRMWRMPIEELNSKGAEIFKHFIAGEDLKEYKKEKFIEFPNGNVEYDKKKQEWVLIKPYGSAN